MRFFGGFLLGAMVGAGFILLDTGISGGDQCASSKIAPRKVLEPSDAGVSSPNVGDSGNNVGRTRLDLVHGRNPVPSESSKAGLGGDWPGWRDQSDGEAYVDEVGAIVGGNAARKWVDQGSEYGLLLLDERAKIDIGSEVMTNFASGDASRKIVNQGSAHDLYLLEGLVN